MLFACSSVRRIVRQHLRRLLGTATRTLAILCTVAIQPAGADPIQWAVADGGNGHYYEAVQTAASWFDADAASKAMVFNGTHGHLLTLTSAAELNFVKNHLTLGKYWIGGYQDTTAPDFSEPAGGWRWVTGEPFAYTHWWPTEPNNLNGGEDEIQVDTQLFWNDLPGRFNDPFYYVEFPAPEPSGLVIGLMGTILIVGGSFLTRARNRLGKRTH